jgi:hypothetical protein
VGHRRRDRHRPRDRGEDAFLGPVAVTRYQKFDLKMKPIQYCAGSPEAIDGIVELVNKNRAD